MSSAEEESIKRLSYKKTGSSNTTSTNEKRVIRKQSRPKVSPSSSSSSSSSSSVLPSFRTAFPSTLTSLPEERVQRLQLKQLSELLAENEYMKNSKDSGQPLCDVAAQKSNLSVQGRNKRRMNKNDKDEKEEEEEEEEKKNAIVRSFLKDDNEEEDSVSKQTTSSTDQNGDEEEERQFAFLSLLRSTEQVAAMHTQQIEVDPWQSHAFQQAVSNAPPPSYFLENDDSRQIDTETIQQQLREKRLELQIQTASLESELLAQAGEFAGFRYPACMNGIDACVAAKGTIPGMNGEKGIVLMGFMFQSELNEFKRTKRVPFHGERPCVLCCRCHPARVTLAMRSIMMRGAEGLLRPAAAYEKKAIQVVQCYRNLENLPGGYYREYMFHSHVNEPTIDPIVKLNQERLRAYKDATTGRWIIDQSALVFDKPVAPIPTIGENLNSF